MVSPMGVGWGTHSGIPHGCVLGDIQLYPPWVCVRGHTVVAPWVWVGGYVVVTFLGLHQINSFTMLISFEGKRRSLKSKPPTTGANPTHQREEVYKLVHESRILRAWINHREART